jgi:AcrR family transcriptional regulator
VSVPETQPQLEAPPLGLRERKKQRTRQLIAETARALFIEHGFEHVSVAQIARTAEVSEQTVFNYFPTKEDLVFWRLGSFEENLLAAVADRASGQSALEAFREFLLAQRGLMGRDDPQAQEDLRGIARMISESPALLARERQIFAGYTDALAQLIADEEGARPGDIEPWIAANAMLGMHRSLVAYTRTRVLEGTPQPRLRRDVRAQADRAFERLERGLGDYAIRA